MYSGLLNTIHSSFSAIYRAIDIVIITLLFIATMQVMAIDVDIYYLAVLLISLISFLFFSQSFELYRSWRTSTTFTMISYTSLVWSLCCVILITLAYFTKTGVIYSRLAIGIWFVVTLVTLNVWRIIFRAILFKFRRTGINLRQVVIVGATPSGVKLAEQIKLNPELGLNLKGFFDDRSAERLPDIAHTQLLGSINDAIEYVKKSDNISQVYIALPMKAEERIATILQGFSDTTATVHIIPDFFIYNLLRARWQHIGTMQTLSIFDSPFEGFSKTVKRVEDIVLTSLILPFAVIPMAIIAIAVKLTSSGPIIFKQKRYGLDGKQINIYKFRTMQLVAKQSEKLAQATKFDARFTSIGGFLRKTSLDELPQLFNVILGDMSLVGPRPHAVEHNEEYRSMIGGYMLRHKVKPGITGWAQVNGWRGETDTLVKMEKRVEYDLYYIQNWSLLFDIRILIQTLFTGFVNKNAY
ncbi:undecaprenyl-phosphate glucose phosphotransferase [Colwellia sp. MEBiC06753]